MIGDISLRRALDWLRNRIALTVTRGIVLDTDDSKLIQELTVNLTTGETLSGIENLQGYGFRSRAKKPSGGRAAECLALEVSGSRSHIVVIQTGDRRVHMTALAEGEVVLEDDQGQKVHLKRAGIIVEAPGKPVTIQNAASVVLDVALVHCTHDLQVDGNANITGDVSAGGNVSAAGDVTDQSGAAQSMAAMRTKYDAHKHSVSGIAAGAGTFISTVPDQQM